MLTQRPPHYYYTIATFTNHYTITYTIEYSMIPRARWAGDLQPGVAKMKNKELRSHSGLAWMGTNLVLQTAPPCTAGHHRGGCHHTGSMNPTKNWLQHWSGDLFR